MPKKKVHAHVIHNKAESSSERGYIANDLKRTMNKNEKLIMGILVGGIIIFLAISIVLLFSKNNKTAVTTTNYTTSTLGPTKRVNLTPYPTIPPIKNMTVMVNERMFNPQVTTIVHGNYVDFLNISQNPMTIEANDANSSMLNLGTIQPGDDKQVVFSNPGVYTYKLKSNPAQQGTIIIK